MKRLPRFPLAFLLLLTILPAQESRQSDASLLLDRVAETVGDSAAFGPAMFDAFRSLSDEAAYTLAASLLAESLELGPPPRDVAEALRAVRDDPAVPGPKRAMAAQLRRGVLARQGATDILPAERGRDGAIQQFIVIGPFGFQAESLSGFAFAPEREIELDREYDGFDGRVGWTAYEPSPGEPAADPFNVLSPDSGATYALAQIHVPADRVLTVVLEVSGSGDLWIDGREALSMQRRRDFLPESRWVEVLFPAGWHRLLVKSTDSGVGDFALGILDHDRGPVAVDHAGGQVASDGVRVEVGRTLHAVTHAAAGATNKGAFDARDVRDVLRQSGDRARDLAAAFIWAESGLPESAFAAVERFLAAPDLSLGEIWIAHRLVDQTWHLPENDKKARLLDLAKRAAAQKPGFAPAVVVLANNEAANDRAEEGIGMLQSASKHNPKSVELWDAQLDIMESVGFESDFDRTLDAALGACPEAPKIIDRKLAHLEKKRSFTAWTALALRHLAANAANLDVAHGLAQRLLAARRFSDLRRLLDVQRALYPHDLALANAEAEALHEQGDLAGEKKALEAIAARHVKDTDALETLAARAFAAGEKPDAIACLGRALGRDGDLHHVRRLLTENRPPEHDYFAEFLVDTGAFLAKAPDKDAYPDSRIVLLLDQIVLWVHADGSAEQETHQLHRLQDARGKEDLGTVHADGDVKIVQTILPDGRKLVPNQLGRGAFEMAGLAPGAIVERRHRRFLDRFTGRPESFGGFYFQDTRLNQPFHYSRYVVIVPKKLGLTPVVERFAGEPKREERGDDVVYEFLLERMPRIQKEVLMPRPEDIVPHVEFRRPDKWEQINRRYLDVYEPAWRVTPPIDEAAKKAVGDATDPVERARRLYDFVMDTVTSNDGTGWPTQTLLEKSGDRFPLYLALLKAAGVPHTLAMARAQEKMSPPVNWELVSEDLFDVPLVRIDPPDGKPVYVSTQLRYVPFGLTRYDLTDAPVFVTSPAGGRIERTPLAPLEDARAAQVDMDLALDASGVAQGTVRMTLSGILGAWLKEQIERTDKKRLEQMASQMVLGPIGRLAPKPKGAVRFQNATSRVGPLVIEVDVEMKQLVRKTDGGGTIGLPFGPLALARAFVDRKERKLPFVFQQYVVQDDEARIDLDPAWKIEDLPKDFERTGPLGSYRLRRTANGTKLILRREVALTPANVPAADYPGVASFSKDVDEAEAQKLTLRRETQ